MERAVIHVEQYSLFAKGFAILIKKYIPQFLVMRLPNASHAVEYIRKCFDYPPKIELIVINVTLDGSEAINLAKEIRKLGKSTKGPHIPVLALTMHDYDSPVMQKALKENLFDLWLTKDTEPELLVSHITELLKLNKSS